MNETMFEPVSSEIDLTTEAQFRMTLQLMAQIADRWQARPRDQSKHYGAAMAALFLGRALVAIYQHRPEQSERETFNTLVVRVGKLAGTDGLSVIDCGERPTGVGPVTAAVKNMLDCAAAARIVGDWAAEHRQGKDALAMYLFDRDWLLRAEDTARNSITWPSRGRSRREVEAEIKKLGGRLPPD